MKDMKISPLSYRYGDPLEMESTLKLETLQSLQLRKGTSMSIPSPLPWPSKLEMF